MDLFDKTLVILMVMIVVTFLGTCYIVYNINIVFTECIFIEDMNNDR